RSTATPSRIHHSDNLESLARPGDPNGLPLSDRMARGRPYSRKIRSNARRVCGPSFDGNASRAWVTAYVRARHRFLAHPARAIVRRTIYRTECFAREIERGNWHLQTLPI